MTTIKYFNGKEVIEVEVTDETAAVYQEIRREQWRNRKRIVRHEALYSLDCMQEVSEDGGIEELIRQQREPDSALVIQDALTEIVETEERDERNSKIRATLKDLTPEQKNLVQMLMSGLFTSIEPTE